MKRVARAIGSSAAILLLAGVAVAGPGAVSSSGQAPTVPVDALVVGDPTEGPPLDHSVYNGTVIFSCVNADATGTGSHVLDRDNTGLGQEQLRVDITDGFGTTIYTLTYQNVLGSFAGGIGNFFYTQAPQANPITFRLTSLAGNGLPEQLDYQIQGWCQGLNPLLAVPTLDRWGLIALVGLLGLVALVAMRRRRLA